MYRSYSESDSKIQQEFPNENVCHIREVLQIINNILSIWNAKSISITSNISASIRMHKNK